MRSMRTRDDARGIPLLRYRFDADADVELHFHDVQGSSLFFCPAALPWQDGKWVFVEFGLARPEVVCLMRGRVHGQQSARFLGSWIEFPVHGFPALVKTISPSRRARERLATDLTVAISRPDGGKALCRMADVSVEGMRLSGLPFPVRVGEQLSLQMIGGSRSESDLGTGMVKWVRGKDAGLHFSGAATGRNPIVRLVDQASKARESAVEVAHDSGCPCTRAARPEEPPLPERREAAIR
jgi:PilZ domain